MQPGVVEGVILVREDFDGGPPRACWRLGFGVPKLAECGRLAARLQENGDPPFAERVPGNGTAVGFHGRAVTDSGQRGLRLERLPGGRILPSFESGGTAEPGSGFPKS